MKRVIIIGGSGSLVPHVVEALERLQDVELTLFVRNPKRLSQGLAAKHRVFEGDVLKYNDVKEAIAGQDIVYVNLAGNLETMGRNILKAMQQTGVKRIIAVSSIGIYEEPVKSMLAPYRNLADIIEASGLDYTILRPDWFTNANEVDYALTKKGEPEQGNPISRKSIAAFVSRLVDNPQTHSKANYGISKP